MASPREQALPTQIVVRSSGEQAEVPRAFAVGFSAEGGSYTLDVAAEAMLAEWGVDGLSLLERASAKGSGGEVVGHELFDPAAPGRLLLVGLGSGTPRDFRRAGASIAREARRRGPVATPLARLADDTCLAALVEGLVLGAFDFTLRSSEDATDADGTSAANEARDNPPRVVLTGVGRTDVGGDGRAEVIEAANRRAQASWRARTYALTPSNLKGPPQLEAWAREAAKQSRLDIDVWDDRRLARDGFGGILAVGSGSAYPSRFIRLDYAPRSAARAPHLVIAGKGITFDSGGISIKPRDSMMTMKRDMTGAGVVIAVMGALKELGVQLRVTGLVASAENAFGAASMRPGDVVTHYGGRTSEVGNTDAEGRLVLADALAYADKHLDASAVVDIATLTGAGKVALGTTLAALFANDDALAQQLWAAGEAAGEPVWRLPLVADYEPLLENTFADATNAAGGPGAITAALFLQHFAGSAPWAHLDIASVGDSAQDAFEYTKGATGFGARLLLRWIKSREAAG